MPRKPFFRAADGWWYAQLTVAGKRKQVRLAKGKENERDAYCTFCRLVADHGPAAPPDPARTVAAVCDLFLDTSQRRHTPDTYDWHRRYLQSFCDRHGRLAAADLRPFHVANWLDAHPAWKGSRRHAGGVVKRAFAWAEQQGHIAASPVRAVRVPRSGRRTRVLSPDERAQILAAVPDRGFREFVYALQETGCRPGEVAKVTAAQADLTLGVWSLDEHKTAGKTGRPRVVYLSPGMLALTRELAGRHPAGPLFRGRDGRGFTRNAVRCRFRRLRAKLPGLKPFTAYSYRHTFTTDALTNGVGVAQVAELLGHAGTDMVMRHYQHLSQRVAHMRDAAARAVRPGEAAPGGPPAG